MTELTGTASDDNGFEQTEAARLNAINNAESNQTTNSNNEMETLNESFAGKTVAGGANANNAKTTSGTTTTTGAKPGKRTQNPLSNFSSYTYQITLYMITPDAYDAFIETGRRKIDALSNGTEGAFIVAQSGGVNNETSKRPPGFKYDYFIDDLKIKASLNGKESLTASNVTSLSFNIYEPYGFSFISNIANAALALKSNKKNFRDLSNASRQFFVLGIRFQGYDKDGKLISGSETTQQNTVSNPQGEPGGIFERFFDIYLASMKFKIDGKLTVYNITAATVAPRAAFGIKRGTIKTGAQVVAGTVQQALGNEGTDPEGIKSLLGTLNEQERLYVKNAPASAGAIANVYRLEFQGLADVISNASIVTESDKRNKDLWPMSKAAKTIQVNETISVSSTPDNTKRSITFRNGMSIMQAISSIISQSTYMADALKVIYTSEIEPDQNSNGEDEIVNKEPKTFKWYNLGARVKPLGFDKNVGDWAYEITYVIQPYECPAIISPYAGKAPKYYGPHKRYEYWYTGKNSEIINYEQRLDNAYFNTAVMPSGDDASHGGGQDVPTTAGMRQNEDRTGQKDIGKEAQNSILTSLFSPGDYAQAKITIMGDPDYLIQDSPATTNAVYSQYYGTDGFTINPNGGQVFIEIDFKEAEDYKVDSGLLTINQSILFWKYPSSINIKGVSYMVNTVTSTMSKGKFTQDLECVINTFPGATDTAAQGNRESSSAPTTGDVRTGTTQGGTTGTQSSSGQSSTSGDGLTTDSSATNTQNTAPETPPSDASQVTSPTGGSSTPAPPPAPPPFVLPNPSATLQASTTFAGATIKATVAPDGYSVFVSVFLPSGKELLNVNGWGPAQWDAQIAIANPQDLAALTSLKASADTVITPLTNDVKAKIEENNAARKAHNELLSNWGKPAGTSNSSGAVNRAVADDDATGSSASRVDVGGRED